MTQQTKTANPGPTTQAPTQPPSEERAIVIPGFGDRTHIRELADRLAYLIIGGRKLEASERLALAQIAVAHNLDPTIGEVWYIPGSGPMVGIKGLRKEARRQAKDENTTYWLETARIDPSEVDAPVDAVVYQVTLRDSATVQSYSHSINALTSSGVPYAEAIDLLGPPPKYIGIGIATTTEKSKMGIVARAKKRAEAEALKLRFDVEFAGARSAGDVVDEPEIVPADFQLAPGPDGNGSGRSTDENLTSLGY